MQRKQVVESHPTLAAARPDAAPRADHDSAEMRARQKAFASCLATVRQRGGVLFADAQRQRNAEPAGEPAWANAFDTFSDSGRDGGANDSGGEDGGNGEAAASAWVEQARPLRTDDNAGVDGVWNERDDAAMGAAAGAAIADPLVHHVCGRLLEAVRVSMGATKLTVRVPLGDGPLSGADAVLTREGNQLTVRIRAATGDLRCRLAGHAQALRRRLVGAAPDCLVMVDVCEGGGDERTEYA
ncbi:hypothetical protein [Paraburkholderia madseniana]|uniref:hypothetical protein n=1 Tax=Paraburkholderia madseniana TaxID=2599607 RepID=UPI001412FC08|nr:hypothetical protein [Paraburkholderia madseniana]